jgi:transposase InsO family protein
VGSTVTVVVGLAKMSSDRSTRDGRRLAPQSLRLVLDQEVTTPPRTTGRRCGDTRLDSAHEPSEPAVGSTPHSRRTAQVGDQGGTIDGGQIPVPTPEAAFADLANLPGESCGTNGFDRLLHGFDRDLPGSFVFVVLSHARRRVLHFQVTEHPTQEWTMQRVREAFPWDQAPHYLPRDRDAIYGGDFAALSKDRGMEEVITAPRCPWQNPYVERLIGSVRRECLDHFIVWNQRSLRRILQSYFAYYQRSRTHLALDKDAPEPRTVQPPDQGRVLAIPQVGGLHHRYQRRAA